MHGISVDDDEKEKFTKKGPKELTKLLEKFKELFSPGQGNFNKGKMKIKLKDDVKPDTFVSEEHL